MMSWLIIGLEEGPKRDELALLFQQLMKGMLSIPVNFPFTSFNNSLKATKKIRILLKELIREKRVALDQRKDSSEQDLITCLISLENEDGSPVLSDEEIIDNAVAIMVAGHDTTSIPLTFLVRLLATNSSVHAGILREQEEIGKSKAPCELLTWDDLMRMKYSWRVVSEILRMTPPVLCTYRKVLQDFEYEGFLIPKGWQVMWATNMTHMDDEIFPEASKFDPARFEKSPPPYSFIAFGGGLRICPGIEFAKIEILITVHNLVTQFNWKLSSPDMSFSRDPLPSFKNGLEILIEPKISTN